MAKPKKQKPEPQDAFKKGYDKFLDEVGLWCKSRVGRSSELAVVLGVKRYQVHDWFVSKRFAVPGWVVFTIPKVLITSSAKLN
jgi:hypothetical protein